MRETSTTARETQTRTCAVCGHERLLVLFPRQPGNGVINKRCQLCRDTGAKRRPKDVLKLRSASMKAHRMRRKLEEARLETGETA